MEGDILQMKAWSHSWQMPALSHLDLVEAEPWKFESD